MSTSRTIRVGVLADGASFSRFNAWETLLPLLNPSDHGFNYRLEVETFRLPDLVSHGYAGLGGFIGKGKVDVLIVNWDAANGDPAFRSDLAVDWLAHRRPEILKWLGGGRVLVIESQAMMSMPSQRAYDALVGERELPTCGARDPKHPLKLSKRTGGCCHKTKCAPTIEGFQKVADFLENRAFPTADDLFPKDRGLLTEHITEVSWEETLYRGWFRRSFIPQWRLPWVSIIRTDKRGLLKNHSTMKVAKVGDKGQGAIFATTMFLATTKQCPLILAILNCAGGNTSHLPSPRSWTNHLRKVWERIVPIVAATVAGFWLSQQPVVLKPIMETLVQFFGDQSNGFLKGVVTLVFASLGLGVGNWVAIVGWPWLKRQAWEIAGL